MISPQASSPSLELTITGVAHGGDGIGRIDSMACFVAGALPGDTVRVRIYRRTSNALWGHLLEVVSPSPHRITGSACAGRPCAATCAWHDFAYPAQAEWKQQIVRESIRRIGRIEVEVAFVEAPELRHGYRTRAVFHGDGTALGYYAPRTHDIIPLPACPLNHQKLNGALETLRPLKLRGNIHVTVNPEGEEILISISEPTAPLRELFPLTDSFNSRTRHQFLFDGVPIVNGTFSQASLLLNRMLRRETDRRIGAAASLLDLYCGNGNLSLHHTDKRKVVGVDHAGASISAANELSPGVYKRGDEQAMTRLIQECAWEVILLDPPRTGANALVPSLVAARTKRIVYVSCNPATFARDASGLASGGWRLTSVAALDMFPHTPHVETIGVFERD
jgi:23S rRNA (uracil1939-C5)-methyltransferase